MEKLTVLDDSINFYSKPDVNDTKKRKVEKNEELNIISIEKTNDVFWINVLSDNSLEAYTNELDKIAILLPVIFSKGKDVKVYSEPNSNSNQIAFITSKELFYLLHKTYDTNDQTVIWRKIKLANDTWGYINTDIDINPVNKSQKNRKNKCLISTLIIVGLVFLFNLYAISNGNSKGVATISLVLLYLILNSLLTFISYFFRSNMEKYYYPNLLSIYNNQIIYFF